MNCEEFHERMNDCLDAGRPPSRDRQLRQHTFDCRECRSDLRAWQSIARSVAPQGSGKTNHPWRIALPVALAAGLCFLLLGDWRPAGDNAVATDPRLAAETRPSEKMGRLPTVPPQWSDPEWVERWADRVAEPLAPLSQGLAPLGRSFQTAITLLVLPAEGGEPEVQPLAQPLQSNRFVEIREVSYA